MTSRSIRSLFAILGALILVIAPGAIASAHSSVVASSPGSLETVGGEVVRVDLIFNDGVEQAEMELEAPDGSIIPGTVEQRANNWLRYGFEPLSIEGQYVLRYSFISEDTDPVSDARAFRYSASAPEPFEITSSQLQPSEGPSIVFWIVSFVGLAVLAILAGLLAERTRKLRLVRASEEPSSTAVD